MDKKKAIVIAVVLFLLIGLGTFVFANPSGERLDGDGTDSVTEMDGNSEVDDNNTDGEEETIEGEEEPAETEEDEEDGDVIPVYNDQTGNSQNGGSNQGSNNNNNNQGGSQVEDNSRYLAALEALEKAEASFSQSDLDYANSLIDALENNGNKTDLSNRADVVQNVIDVETLVKNLQTKVDESENITNINDARDYRANEEIIAKVDELAASTKKDELTSILNDLSKVLDDTKAPIISGIDNGIVTVLDVSLAVDESDVKVYVNGEEKSLADLTFDKEGDYTVKVVDKAYNETTLQFAIDKTVPEFNVASGTHSDTAMNIVVTDDHFASIHVVNQDTGDVKDYTTNEITLEDEATYHITAYDKAGSYKDIWVAIDKTAPTVNATGTGVNNFFRDEEVTLTAFDKFLTEVTVNGETYGKGEFTYAGNNENATFTKVFTEEGKYDVVAKDKFGHETTYTFVIDHTAPVLNGVVDGGTYKEATLEIVEENLHTAKISKNGEKAENFTSGYKVSESGTYTVTLIDKAYNKLEVTFTIDADAPVVEVNYSTTEPTNGSVIVTLTANEEVEITSQSGTWNPNSGFATKFQKSYPANQIQSVTVTDKVGNSTTVEIKVENIDRVAPQILNIKQEYEDAEGGRIKVTFYTSEAIFGKNIDTDTVQDNEHSIRKVSDTEYYTYYYRTKEVTLNFTDAAGNAGSYTFVVDKTAPEVEVSYNYGSLTNHSETVTLKFNEAVTFDTMETWLDKGNNVYQKVFPENTTQEIHFRDAVGNPGTLTIQITWIDKEAPVLTVVEPNNYDIEVNTPYVDKGYSAYDNYDGDLTDKVIMSYLFLAKGTGNWTTVDRIDTSVFGTYKITYQVSDAAGNVAKATRSFEIVDSIKPEIIIKDSSIGTKEENIFSEVSFQLHDSHLIAAAKLNDTKISLTPNSWSDINFVKVGKYGAVYGENTLVVTDVYGNEAEYKFVLDNKVPQLKPEQWNVTVEANKDEQFSCPDMTAFGTDEYGVSKVEVDTYYSKPDISQPGKFTCRYKTTDKAGNYAYNDITYTVVDTTPATFIPSYYTKNVELDINGKFTDYPTIEVKDNASGQVTYQLISDNVDVTKVGDYALVYETVDANGNKSTHTIPVRVRDHTSPNIGDLESNKTYYENIPYNMSDNSGAFTLYYAFNEEYNSCDELIAGTPNSAIPVTGTYSGTYPVPMDAKNVSVCLVDASGNQTFRNNITIRVNKTDDALINSVLYRVSDDSVL